MNQAVIVLTGATGFLGSSLALHCLQQRSETVVCLTRDDPDGSRTQTSLREAAQGFHASLSNEQWARLRVVGSLEEAVAAVCDAPYFYVWHCAADMRYDLECLPESFAVNVGLSTRLFKLLAELPNCRRYYHVSTAYTAGFDNLAPQETLHVGPRLINAYQISKWSAEMSLATMAHSSRAPLTLVRPSIVVGHTHSGWHGKNKFGLHGVLNVLRSVLPLIKEELVVNLAGDAQSNYIPINHVVDNCLAIMQADAVRQDSGLEIYHVVGNLCFSNARIAKIVAQSLDIKIRFGPSQSRIDQRFNEMIATNQAFASHTWAFCQAALKKKIGAHFSSFDMTDDVLLLILNS